MIVRIRRDPNAFEKYQHNKELVALVNLFADNSLELPQGWDTKKDRNSKVSLTWNRICRILSITSCEEGMHDVVVIRKFKHNVEWI